jgi:hypothetical protein
VQVSSRLSPDSTCQGPGGAPTACRKAPAPDWEFKAFVWEGFDLRVFFVVADIRAYFNAGSSCRLCTSLPQVSFMPFAPHFDTRCCFPAAQLLHGHVYDALYGRGEAQPTSTPSSRRLVCLMKQSANSRALPLEQFCPSTCSVHFSLAVIVNAGSENSHILHLDSCPGLHTAVEMLLRR